MKVMIIQGKLRTLTAFHTGHGGSEFHTDMPLAKDGNGRYYIPGTTLAGALRDYLNRRLGYYDSWYSQKEKEAQDKILREKEEPTAVKELFGFQKKQDGQASSIIIDDAPAAENVNVSVRDHVVIIRETGGAVPGLKFDREIIQAGATFDFRMEITFRHEEENKRTPYIRAMLEALQSGEIRLGGATSRGLGDIWLENTQIYSWNLAMEEDFEDYLTFLVNGHSRKLRPLNELPVADFKPEPFVEVIFVCGIDGPFMIKDGAVDEHKYIEWKRKVENVSGEIKDVPDMVCLMETDSNGNPSFVIPGSSIKGAFRVQAERIIKQCRNVVDEKFWLEDFIEDGVLNMKKFAQYLEVRKEKHRELEEVRECFGDADEGQGSFIFTDAYFKPKKNLTKITNHVAIDPLTGGAIDSALYSMEAIWNDEEAEFELKIRVQRPKMWQLGLMGHLLKDLFTGRIRLGFGKTRGMGRVVLKRVKEGRAFLPELFGKEEVVTLPTELTTETMQYLDKLSLAFNQKMAE